ncbi:conserved hypothetical protein [Ferrimonas balearica DSM 9799]|uniref:DUF2541 domain-containing protein n=1 Tax=Ferrimonas balearica (strain DSM 9799 / CCM 4581 / KCTC 23876 / PAT) TaxID=550540 RepID=E1SPV7_FERBD|nr:DUF2541 family protein [Ferrimonas balearica]ADN75752.1 conserved hypothetical protein [Ferrimonas balearica DSM 9799]
MINASRLAPILLLASTLLAPAAALADDDFTLGRTILLEHGNRGADIPLLVCRNTNAIKLKAKRRLHLKRIKVTFQNGDTRTFNYYRDMKKGEQTQWRKFAYSRCVTHIEVFGNSDGSSAGVTVLGHKR